MRAIFITLVVINLVLLAVFWLRAPEPVVSPSAAPVVSSESVGQLTLLSELPDGGASLGAAGGGAALSGGGSSDGGGSELSDVRHELSSEVEVNQWVASREAGGDRDDGRAVCTLVGPFKERLAAEYFVERLGALDVVSSVEVLEVPGDPGFWVYQAPEVSRKAALRRLHELQAKGIDSYVIPKGDLENGISFGLFSDRSRAEEQLEVVQSSGYPANIRTVPRSFEEVWVSMVGGEAEKIGSEHWFELLNREEDLEKRQNFCPDVASE
ncbi:SPOR domain-containing protein [Aestuariicella sp. G3-2]|uniref:SPOR domain-containing protein n=1 Tax=Pseudomaricurvus albidus TaxID=2842452 RepID=UPI001C0E18D4|nr:SPOR domain-containing protein [Aestuariicella albida]MBU3068201.1 SPOR domain-containing protein [Aestuariicella albida]